MPPKVRKIAILGSRAVGKSSVTLQFVDGHFAENYFPTVCFSYLSKYHVSINEIYASIFGYRNPTAEATIENLFTKTVKFKGEEYIAEIIDTAGQDEFSILNSKHAVGIHGYVLVYSIASRQSFEIVSILRDKILSFTGMNWIPCVLVANKVDLHPQRQVSTEEGQKLAQEWNCAFIETSAKHNQNISRIFDQMLNEIEKNRNDGDQATSFSCIIL